MNVTFQLKLSITNRANSSVPSCFHQCNVRKSPLCRTTSAWSRLMTYSHRKAEPLHWGINQAQPERKRIERGHAIKPKLQQEEKFPTPLAANTGSPETSRREPLKRAFNNGKIDKRTAGCEYTLWSMYMSTSWFWISLLVRKAQIIGPVCSLLQSIVVYPFDMNSNNSSVWAAD